MTAVGEERDPAMGWLCGYAPTGISCDREAKWHGVKVSDNPDLQWSFAACDGHVESVRSLCDYVHTHETPCGVPGSLFIINENRCIIEWGAAAPSLSAVTGAHA